MGLAMAGLWPASATPALTPDAAPPPVASATPPVVQPEAVLTPPPAPKPRPVRRTTPVRAPVAAPAPAVVAPRVAGRPVSAEDITAFTDTLIPALMQRDHVLGVTVAVVQGDTPLLIKGYGYDRLSPLRPVDANNSLFRIGSITKTFTWIVARQEIEAGRIKLDAPLQTYLPPDIYKETAVKGKELRLRDLMAHTGGFEDTALGHLFRLDVSKMESTDTYFRRHAPARIRDRGLYASYSNYGAALAARALERTSQAQDVPSLMEARVFTPLGLSSTTLREPYDPDRLNAAASAEGLPSPMPDALTARLSQGFVWNGATFVPKPFDHTLPMSGALGASTTSTDMARFMSLLLADGRLGETQLFDAGSAKAFRSPLLVMPNGYNGWASGFMMRETPQGLKAYGHSGSTLWFNATLVLIPDLDIGIFIATNTATGDSLARSYPDLLIRHVEGLPPAAPRLPLASQAYDRNAAYYESLRGHYVSSRRAYRGLEGAVTRLINTVEVDVDAEGRLILSATDGLSAYLPATPSGFFVPQSFNPQGSAIGGEGLHFLFRPNGGKATAFETTANMARFERVGFLYQPGFLAQMTFIMGLTCVLVLIGLGRFSQRDRPTDPQIQASFISYALAATWILAIWIFHDWQSKLGENPSALFTDWPSGQLRLAASLAILAALGTVFQLFTLIRVYEEASYHSDGWALWQKVMHTALNIAWALYALLLMSWGALSW